MDIFRLFGQIAVDNSAANDAIEDTANRAEDASSRSSNAFDGIGRAALNIGKMVLTAGVALGGAWVAAIEGSREYRTEMGKLDTAFTTNGHSTAAVKKTYSDLQAVLGDTGQAVEAANHLALLADNEKDLQTWTEICTGVYAQFGESLPIESLTESANEVAKSGELTGGLVDALVWAGIGEEEFQAKLDACTTEQERQKLIMDTLNGTYSKASEQYKETNKDILEANRANEKLTNAFAQLGAIGEPILTAIKTKVAEMVAAAVPMVESFVQKVKDLRTWIANNQTTIDAWVAVIIGASVSIGAFLLVLKWGAIMTAASNAIKGVRAAILLFNAALKANPIGLVVSLIAGLVAAFAYLWKNNEGFRKFWLDLWAKIKSACGSAVGWIKTKFGEFQTAFSTVKTVFGNIQKTISEKINSARDKVKNAIDKIKGFFKFSWSLPKLKMPTFTIKGKFALDPPSVPKLAIKWNAEGGILNEATIFGAVGNTLLGGGEAGAEAIAPIALLQDYIREAVKAENETVARTIIEQTQRMLDYLARAMPKELVLDTGVLVGELTPAIDYGLADRWENARRGNTR